MSRLVTSARVSPPSLQSIGEEYKRRLKRDALQHSGNLHSYHAVKMTAVLTNSTCQLHISRSP